MTVCLTGDVHHMSLETRDQEYMDRTEVEAALEYADIAGEYGVPVTLFVTGKTAKEEPERVRTLAAMDHVEIGGHNYWAFSTPVHKLSRGLTGSWNGPRRFQSWEIRRTLETFDNLGIDVSAWRDHAYRHDGNTATLLADHDITHFSDAVGPDEPLRRTDDLTIVPVNTPPDHEHVYHAFRTPEFVADDEFSGPFGDESYPVDEWLDWVLDEVEDRVASGTPATVLAHPACMVLADDLNAFEQLCRRLAETDEQVHLTDVNHG